MGAVAHGDWERMGTRSAGTKEGEGRNRGLHASVKGRGAGHARAGVHWACTQKWTGEQAPRALTLRRRSQAVPAPLWPRPPPRIRSTLRRETRSNGPSGLDSRPAPSGFFFRTPFSAGNAPPARHCPAPVHSMPLSAGFSGRNLPSPAPTRSRLRVDPPRRVLGSRTPEGSGRPDATRLDRVSALLPFSSPSPFFFSSSLLIYCAHQSRPRAPAGRPTQAAVSAR